LNPKAPSQSRSHRNRSFGRPPHPGRRDRFRRARASLGLALALALAASLALLPGSPARAQWPPPDGEHIDLSDPQYWPNDPDYENLWNYWSWIHPEAVDAVAAFSPYELELGSGSHVDRAWQKTTGDRRVVLAILDGGIRWSVSELVNQHYLNRGELPPPDAGCGGDGVTYDVNGDGWFNVQDYTENGVDERPVDVCDTRLLGAPGGWDVVVPAEGAPNGMLDPGDLIAFFSDGVDDDGNGWVDDISGWDMYLDNNNADTETNFYHGKNTAQQAGAQGNNGAGSIGTCPHCAQLQIRVGESFVVDANDFAMGVIFAVDSGASVIVAPVGSINNPQLARDAIDYAWENGVAVVASAADENSFHHNFPSTANHTIYQHAIQYDAGSFENASTYLNFSNCTNYGAQLVLSTPGTLCSSESTGRLGGMVGLIYAMALQADVPFPGGAPGPTDHLGARRLRADEVRELLIMTVDDIHDPATADDPSRYPTREGWEARFGYGRTNIGDAVREVEAGRIPPVVDITEPLWFEPIYPAHTPSVAIRGEVSFRAPDASGFDSVDYVLEWAPGIEPDDADFTVIDSQTGVTGSATGLLATWDVADLVVNNPPQPAPDYIHNRHLVTLRIRATAHSTDPLRDGVKAELRKAVHVVADPDLLPGFPIYLGAGGLASPKLADLDADGVREIVYPDNNGRVHAYKGDGSAVAGWPQTVNPLPHLDAARAGNHRASPAFAGGSLDPDVSSAVVASPAVADLDGDDEPEVVVASLDGFVYVWDSAGVLKPGFPVELDRSLARDTHKDRNLDSGIFAAPAVADLDGDGDHEIVVGAMDGHVYAWHHDGTLLSGFPVELRRPDDEVYGRSLSSPAIGDVNGDGSPDIVLGSSQIIQAMAPLWAIQATGNDHAEGPFLEGFPARILAIEELLPLVGQGLTTTPALADIDDDPYPEILISGIAGPPRFIDGDGYDLHALEGGTPNSVEKGYGPASNSADLPSVTMFTTPSLGDLNNDGRPDVFQGVGGMNLIATMATGGQRLEFDHLLGGWDAISGRFLHAFPRVVDDWQFFMSTAVADLDDDGLPEAIQGTAGYFLHAFNRYGEEPEGWPKFTGGWIGATAAVGDVTGDGNLEVVTTSRNGWLFAWRTPAPVTSRIDWASYKHDNQNTGNLGTPLDQGTQEPHCEPDIDGDGQPNEEDGDIDGDGVANHDDDDVDGDGVPNAWDFDDDGDCIHDDIDETPRGPTADGDDDGDGGDGCGCDASGATDAGLALALLLLGLLWLQRRRRQGRC